jgi:hypothetical protein
MAIFMVYYSIEAPCLTILRLILNKLNPFGRLQFLMYVVKVKDKLLELKSELEHRVGHQEQQEPQQEQREEQQGQRRQSWAQRQHQRQRRTSILVDIVRQNSAPNEAHDGNASSDPGSGTVGPGVQIRNQALQATNPLTSAVGGGVGAPAPVLASAAGPEPSGAWAETRAI